MEATGKPIRVIQVALHYADKSKLNSNIWVQTAKETTYQPDTSMDISEQSDCWRETIQSTLPVMMRKAESVQLDWLNQSLCDLKKSPEELSTTIKHCRQNNQLTQMQSWLNLSGLELSVLQRHTSNRSMAIRLLAESLVTIGGLPIALYGLSSHSLVATVHYLLTRHHSTAADKWASNSFVIGIPLYLLFWLTLALLIHPIVAVITAAAGIYGLKYCQAWETHKKALFTAFCSLAKPKSRDLVLTIADQTLKPFSMAANRYSLDS
jgi:hypothetical protein